MPILDTLRSLLPGGTNRQHPSSREELMRVFRMEAKDVFCLPKAANSSEETAVSRARTV